jgi:riboflavin kinase/FMN adenylyltransferase
LITSFERSGLPAPPARGSVVSVGVFDGVHLGHQAILAANVARARELELVPTVVTFRQHPKSVLLGRAPRTLTSLEHRLELFRRAGIEHTLALTFDEELRRISAREFTFGCLVEQLGARKFVLGFDSKFGRDRQGTAEFLKTLGLDVDVVPQVVVADRPVSSTAIREAVELGDLASAARMLGRPVALYGEVVHGDARGRTLGFPTANLDLHHELRPPNGVYACFVRRMRARGDEDRAVRHSAVANIGVRPTIAGAGSESVRVEVHLLDFDGELYGEYLELEFVACLREEQRFSGPEALKAQIALDVARAKELLARQTRAARR